MLLTMFLGVVERKNFFRICIMLKVDLQLVLVTRKVILHIFTALPQRCSTSLTFTFKPFAFHIAVYADDTTLYSERHWGSDLWQQLELSSELESDLEDRLSVDMQGLFFSSNLDCALAFSLLLKQPFRKSEYRFIL